MAELKLGRLPDRTPVKITISVTPDLSQALSDYAELYLLEYGKAEAVSELIPAILSSFLESDRAFLRHRKERKA